MPLRVQRPLGRRAEMALAFVGADVFDGRDLRAGHGVVVEGTSANLMPLEALPAGIPRHTLKGGTLMPGFVDLQVNGGGGVMLNDAPNVDTLTRIAQAHRAQGTLGLLPTLITDRREVTAAAIKAASAAVAAKVPGVLGLHLEGPHLDVARKGAHEGALIRPMEEADLRMLLEAAEVLPNLMVTLAPQAATFEQIRTLARAGVIVSLGHSDTNYDAAMRAFEAGARCVTHLFNAMSPLSARAPGLVGAALAADVAVGLIADGIHVHPASIRAALGAKAAGAVFLVSDAMACAGTQSTGFTLNGRQITRRDGRLTLSDGTLAGADLSMARATQVMHRQVGEPPARAYGRATRLPADVLRAPLGHGGWPDTVTGLIHLDATGTTARPLETLV